MVKKKQKNRLTKKQELFAREYVKLDNASAAYRLAYKTKNWKDKTVHEAASRMANSYKVGARIEELKAAAAKVAKKKFNIDSEEILRHLNVLRSSRIDEYVLVKDGKLTFKDFDQLTEEQLMCIESVKNTKEGIELKLHGKDWTIEKISRHIGFYEKDNSQLKSNIQVALPQVIFKTDE